VDSKYIRMILLALSAAFCEIGVAAVIAYELLRHLPEKDEEDGGTNA
jgi:hypothetical protein